MKPHGETGMPRIGSPSSRWIAPEVSGVELADSQLVPMNRNIRVRWVSDSLLMIQANLIRRIKEPMAMAGNEREVLTHPERLILTHLVLQDSRSGQGRQFRFTPPFGSSWTSSTRESGSSRRSSRRSGNDASGGPKVAAVIRSPWKIWFHSLNGKLLVTSRLGARSGRRTPGTRARRRPDSS